jgi:hypothetical protein
MLGLARKLLSLTCEPSITYWAIAEAGPPGKVGGSRGANRFTIAEDPP